MLGSSDCFIIVLKLGQWQWNSLDQALSCYTRKMGTNESAVTPGAQVCSVQWESCIGEG